MSTKTSDILDDLKEKIMDGIYKGDSKLPTEQELISYYAASRNTVRNVLKELEIEGLIYSRQGSGYYTQDEQIVGSIALRGLSETPYSQTITNKVLKFEKVHADHELSQLFDIPLNNRVIYFRRLRYKSGVPLQLEDSYLPFFLFPTLIKADIEGSIFHYVEVTKKLRIKYARRDYQSILMSEEEKQLMNFPVNEPVAAMKTISTNYLDIGRVFERSVVIEPNAMHTDVARRH
ncbi:GntR family transcriptional regulator [Lacticaseibacillus suibinensis]|uniref:GntR family transcriptional regulator n=1 Tax=Lacticaseibacillus suibinensis TaxID=2486011 RepID=UPI00194348F5|nr:GntR family transcriptional regulator [Lacticaseibacillus suibinensis]